MSKQHDDNIERSRGLRRRSTYPERLVWGLLRDRRMENTKFRRQQPIGRYVVDFFAEEVALVVEIDGSTHEGRVKYDAERTDFLNSLGIEVLRVANLDVIKELEAVRIYIAAAVRRRRERNSNGSKHLGS